MKSSTVDTLPFKTSIIPPLSLHALPELSLIVPIYNSSSFLKKSLEDIESFLNRRCAPAELILALDGPTDGSYEICKEFKEGHHSFPVRLIHSSINRGKGFVVRKAMLEAKGEYRVFIDADLAYPVSEVEKILSSLKKNNDLALACRTHPDSRYTLSPAFFRYLYTRHISGRIFNFAVKKTLLPGLDDTQAGLKGFSKKAAEKIFPVQRLNRFSADVEVLYIAVLKNLSVDQVPINFKYDEEPTTIQFSKDTVQMLFDLVKIRLTGLLGKYL
ncbi:MAG: glycosyltransferase [Nitrospinota bacterium]